MCIRDRFIVNATRVPPRPIGGYEALEGLFGGLLGGSGAALWRPGALFGSSGAALGRLWGAYGRLVGPKWPQVDARMVANGVKRPQEAATRPLRVGFWSPKMAPRGSKEPSREA